MKFLIPLLLLIFISAVVQAQSDQAYEQAKLLFSEKKYAEAAAVLDGISSLGCAERAMQAVCYQVLGQSEKALPIFEHIIRACVDTTGPGLSGYLAALINLGSARYNEGNFADAYQMLSKAFELVRLHMGTTHPQFALLAQKLPLAALSAGEYKKAVVYASEAAGLPAVQQNIPVLFALRETAAKAYILQAKYAPAALLLDTAESIIAGSGTQPADLLFRLYTLRLQIAEYTGNTTEQLRWTDSRAALPGLPEHLQVTALTAQARQRIISGDYRGGVELAQRALSLQSLLSGEDLLMLQATTAAVYRLAGNSALADSLYVQATQSAEQFYGAGSTQYADMLNNRALLADEIGRYDEAATLYRRSLEVCAERYGTGHPEYAATLANFALHCMYVGNYAEAENNFNTVLTILPESNYRHAEVLNNRGSLYLHTGRHAEAVSVFEKSLRIHRRLFPAHHPEIVAALNNLAGAYEANRQVPQAADVYDEALLSCSTSLGTHHSLYASLLNNVGVLRLQQGKVDEALLLYARHLEITSDIYGQNHPSYATGLVNMAGAYEALAQYDSAVGLLQQAYDIRLVLLGKNHPDISRTLYLMAKVQSGAGNYTAADSLWPLALSGSLELVKNYFPFLSEKERGGYYALLREQFDRFNSYVLLRKSDNLLVLMYNYRLATKALLFRSADRVRRRVLASGDTRLIALYERRHELRETLAQAYAREGANYAHIEPLEKEANALEKQLSSMSNVYRDDEGEHRSFADVVNALQPGQAAVEIIRVENFEFDSSGKYTGDIVYVLLSALPGAAAPVPVYLHQGLEMEQKYIKAYKNFVTSKLDDKASFGHFWEPIHQKLTAAGVNQVYLSADGVYHLINIAGLLTDEGAFVADAYGLHWVSNTGVLLHAAEARPVNTALLMGGPKYYPSGTSGKLAALPGTLTEVNQIDNMLRGQGKTSSVLTAALARESTLKAARSPGVLHIATHGFFDVGKIKSGDKKNTLSSNPLMHSALYLAGAGDALNGRTSGNEDGIFTAFEASNLNLSNTALVVLSACETGKGEIQNGEGVYGLQRAFKAAGARHVLISLWKVDDASTARLMQNFYAQWLQNHPPAEALRLATAQLRKEYPHPYYWAAFVVVE